MAPSGRQLVGSIALAIVVSTRAARVRVQGLVEEQAELDTDLSATNEDLTCSAVVPGSVSRNCAKRAIGACKDKEVVCKCPRYAHIHGGIGACDPSLYKGRKFDPTKLQGEGCSCVTPKWVPTDNKIPTFKCPVQSYFKDLRPELPDVAATALEWCNSKHVPKDKLVPEHLRGLYWMKDGNPHDVAFCTTRAEYDAKTLTAKLSPWTDFMWRKRDNEEVPHTPATVKNLVYTLTFTNESMVRANITTNLGIVNAIASLPLIEVHETDDGKVTATKKGDLYERPTSVLGKSIAKYYAVRVVDDDGNINKDWYEQMKKQEHVVNHTRSWWGVEEEVHTSFVRYDQDC